MPVLSQPPHYKAVLEALPGFTAPAVQEISAGIAGKSIGIKTLLHLGLLLEGTFDLKR